MNYWHIRLRLWTPADPDELAAALRRQAPLLGIEQSGVLPEGGGYVDVYALHKADVLDWQNAMVATGELAAAIQQRNPERIEIHLSEVRHLTQLDLDEVRQHTERTLNRLRDSQ